MKEKRLPLSAIRFLTLFMPILLFLLFLAFVVAPEQNRLVDGLGAEVGYAKPLLIAK